jgi:hypothetical protein
MEKRNDTTLIRIHQAMILVVFIFSLFVKEEVKKFFWLFIGVMVLSLMIQTMLSRSRTGLFRDKVKKHPNQY